MGTPRQNKDLGLLITERDRLWLLLVQLQGCGSASKLKTQSLQAVKGRELSCLVKICDQMQIPTDTLHLSNARQF